MVLIPVAPNEYKVEPMSNEQEPFEYIKGGVGAKKFDWTLQLAYSLYPLDIPACKNERNPAGVAKSPQKGPPYTASVDQVRDHFFVQILFESLVQTAIISLNILSVLVFDPISGFKQSEVFCKDNNQLLNRTCWYLTINFLMTLRVHSDMP